MATFYGEILPVISRAVDDDEDEDESISEHWDPFIHWSSEMRSAMLHLPNHKLECSSLVVAVGFAAAGFLEAYVMHKDYHLVGGIFSGLKDNEPQTLMQNSPTDRTCYIYRSNEDHSAFFCLCNKEVATEQCYAWANQLFSALDASDAYVVVLNTLPTSQFTSEIPTSDLPVPFLRCLKTRKFDSTPVCPFLEQPNLIPGLAAQVMTYCHTHLLKAVLYQCYTDARNLVDLATIKAFLPVLKSVPIKNIKRKTSNASQRLNDIVKLHQVQDTLYL